MRRIKSPDDMVSIVQEYGFLPFFTSAIPGFSVEELADPSVWFPPKGEGVWEWKSRVIAETGGTYGRFFHNRPVFVSKEFFFLLASYRRDGYDFEGFSNDGHATRSERAIYSILEETGSDISSFLRLKAKMSRTTFDKAIAGLQMKTYAVIQDFEYKLTKDGRNYGWGVARYALADYVYEDLEDRIDDHSPEEAYSLLIKQLMKKFHDCDESDIRRLLG